LQVGGVAEQITVVADASAVNTRSGELSYLVDERAIAQLPLNGRNYTDLARPTARPAAPLGQRSAWKRYRSSASKPMPTTPSSGV
jgi:hypothetical protein